MAQPKHNIKDLEHVCKALANKRRLTIILYLVKAKRLSVGAIAEMLSISFKATSRHMLLLQRADILDKEQQGLTMFYFLEKPLHPLVQKVIDLM